jgi:hypothetical protein
MKTTKIDQQLTENYEIANISNFFPIELTLDQLQDTVIQFQNTLPAQKMG